MSTRVVSILGFLAAVAALGCLALRGQIIGIGPVTLGLQGLAVLLMVWARITFGQRSFHAAADTTDGELVTNGPFALMRNPIYAAVILFAWAGVAAHWELASALLACVVTLGMLVRIFAEERELRARYPAYTAYTQRVKRLIPGLF